MIIIKMQGGLGNQMFEYALYKRFQAMGQETKLDISAYDSYKKHNGFELPQIFNINPDIATVKEIKSLTDLNLKIYHSIQWRVIKRKTHIREENFQYTPQILKLKEAYLDGYWQTQKYFNDIKGLIIQEFSFDLSASKSNEQILNKIMNTHSVSIHIRRGDYISDKKAFAMHGGIGTLSYYRTAMQIIKSKIKDPTFFIFSDDAEWVKENFNTDRTIIVDCNKGKDSFKDMFLMSHCRHNIITNSSFSWWGAWLNKNQDKVVIAPDKWFNTKEAPDIWCEDWMKIGVN